MNPNIHPETDRPLREVLAVWRVDAPLPPRFAERVWQRVERRETESPPAPWTQWLDRFAAALGRPRLAVSYVTVLLVAGVLAGFWQAQLAKSRLTETLRARYVQMLDPYQTPRP